MTTSWIKKNNNEDTKPQPVSKTGFKAFLTDFEQQASGWQTLAVEQAQRRKQARQKFRELATRLGMTQEAERFLGSTELTHATIDAAVAICSMWRSLGVCRVAATGSLTPCEGLSAC